MDFASEDKITEIWNANVLQTNIDVCTVRSLDYNGEIKPDSSVSFGYRAEGSICTGEMFALRIMKDSMKTGNEGPFIFENNNFRVEFKIKNGYEK